MPRITYDIHDNDAHQRLDKFAKKLLGDTPLAGIYRMIREKDIVLNEKKSSPEAILQVGDRVRIFHRETPVIPLVGDIDKETKEESPYSIRDMILYEDEDILCLNKPPHLNVHPGDHKTKEVSLIELVQDYYGGKYSSLTFKPSLVHRIDRQTTGCILIAKNKYTLEALLSQLQNHEIDKIYHTLSYVEKPGVKKRDTIKLPLKRYDQGGGAKVGVDPSGEPSVTHYQTLQELKDGKYRLIECRLETGRMHQIRVHLSHIGLPILGDQYYGHRGENSLITRQYRQSHQLLHAQKLSFIHPKTHQKKEIEAPYPPLFVDMLRQYSTKNVS